MVPPDRKAIRAAEFRNTDMGSSSTPSRTTQTTEPPAYLRPYLQHGAGEAQSLYQTGGPQYYGGNTVVPFSQQTEQALGLTEQRALNGSPVNQAAQNYATGILGSTPTSQFGGASNPYLDAQFNRAADQVQNRIQSGFAGSGRNIEAGRPLAAQEMNDLATGIYGGAYENERNRMASDLSQQRALQFSTAGLAPTLAEQDYRDIGALQGVGGQVEDLTGRLMEDQAARWDFGQNAPQMNLDNYLQRLGLVAGGAGNTSTGTTPTYRNRTAGALGGAATGAGLATALGASGPVGWGIAGLGGLLGAFG
jgi:hypothetical protein